MYYTVCINYTTATNQIVRPYDQRDKSNSTALRSAGQIKWYGPTVSRTNQMERPYGQQDKSNGTDLRSAGQIKWNGPTVSRANQMERPYGQQDKSNGTALRSAGQIKWYGLMRLPGHCKVKFSMARGLSVENLLRQNVGSIINYLQ